MLLNAAVKLNRVKQCKNPTVFQFPPEAVSQQICRSLNPSLWEAWIAQEEAFLCILHIHILFLELAVCSMYCSLSARVLPRVTLYRKKLTITLCAETTTTGTVSC